MQVALSPFDIACMLGLELMSQSNGAVHTLYCCLSHHVLHHDTSICRVTFVHPPQTIDIRHHARVPALNQNLKPLRFRSSMDNLQHKSAVRRLAGHLSPPPYPNLQYIYIYMVHHSNYYEKVQGITFSAVTVIPPSLLILFPSCHS